MKKKIKLFLAPTFYLYLMRKSYKMALVDNINDKLQHPIFDTLANLIKKFKSSKSFYSIFYILALFTIQQSIAWKYGTTISSWFESCGEEWYYQFGALIFEHGSIELVVLGVVLIFMLVLVEVNKDNSNKESSLTHNSAIRINGDNSSIANTGNNNQITQNIGITEETHQKIIEPYQEIIDLLKNNLSYSLPIEEKYQLDKQLQEAQKELEKKNQEIATIQQTLKKIESSETTLLKAKEILNTKGTTEAIIYLQSIESKERQKRVDRDMKSLAKEFQLEAQLLIIENRYDEAKKAYLDSIKFNRNYDNSFEYANYLIKNHNTIEGLRQLKILELEVKMNDSQKGAFYNSLGIIYIKEKNLRDAKKTLKKAVNIYQLLIEEDFEQYCSPLVLSMKNYADVVSNNNLEKAKSIYLEAIQLIKKSTISSMNETLGQLLHSLSILYAYLNPLEADRSSQEALTIWKKLVSINRSEDNLYMLASTYNFISELYVNEIYYKSKQEKYFLDKDGEIETMYSTSLSIFRELAKSNPVQYNKEIAMVLINFPKLYAKRHNNLDKGITFYNEALGIIKGLYTNNEKEFGISYADTLITGVVLKYISYENIEIAKSILDNFPNVKRAKELKANILTIETNN